MSMDIDPNAGAGSRSIINDTNVHHNSDHLPTEVDEPDDSPVHLLAEIEEKLEVGSSLESLDQVYILYCEYGRRLGFSVKKGSQRYSSAKKGQNSHEIGSTDVNMKMYHCSCEGLPDNKRSRGRIAAYKKQVTRTNCRARLRVVRDSEGRWTVTVFCKDHNHELVPADKSYLLRSARDLSHAKSSVSEALNAAGIGMSRACGSLEKEAGGPRNVGFTRRDDCLRRETSGDLNALLEFLSDKSNEPLFYWNVQLDDDGRLVNFFLRDFRCAFDYEDFGDVLSVDTPYRTNRNNLLCVPFVGVNHHRQNVMFGLALLSDETTETFEWLFATFLESMDGKEPVLIFSDQSPAIMNGIDRTFRSAKHRLCQWHINQNAPSHFGKLNGNGEFKKLWHHCMNECESEDEFEQSWSEMMETYGLDGNSWFRGMYDLKKRWASVFTNDCFSAGLHATSRSKVIKDLFAATNSLHEFVIQYESLQTAWRNREQEEDALNLGMPGQFIENNRLLNHVARVYTRNMYKKLEFEAHHNINIDILLRPSDWNAEVLEFEVSSDSGSCKKRKVSFNRSTCIAKCTCKMWEAEGVLCRHMWKILYLMNVPAIPDQIILRRWTKIAKQINTQLMTNAKSLDHKAFVKYIMRVVYNMALSCKEDPARQSLMMARISDLAKEMRQRAIRRGGNCSTMPGDQANRTNPAKKTKQTVDGMRSTERESV